MSEPTKIEQYVAGMRAVRAARARGEEPSEELLEPLDVLWFNMDDDEIAAARKADAAAVEADSDAAFARAVVPALEPVIKEVARKMWAQHPNNPSNKGKRT